MMLYSDQGGSDQDHPPPPKCKTAKWLSDKALQIAEKRETRGNGEKEIYTIFNAEFQRTSKRYKKAFVNYQCKYIRGDY